MKWDKPHAGSRANVAAIDLSAHKVVWQAAPGKSVNFVVETQTGILVGTDEGTLVLLNPADGAVVWKTVVDKAEVTRFYGDTEEGFFVSSGDERFWLVDHGGKVVMRCADQCFEPRR
ncbi:MAG: PQQ-binding-like beta-propeller repeat protein [Acidobacteriota bacterium]